MSVQANRVANYAALQHPGDFYITDPNPHEGGMRRLSFLCPCGTCDGFVGLAGVRIRDDGKQTDGAWGWNLDLDKPTVTPSIDIKDGKGGSHWHGFLTAGVFKSC